MGNNSNTLRDARASYFAKSGFDESGYTDRWVDIEMGPLMVRFPNTPGRQRTVPLHDLHHALTGYDATFGGEAQIAAWEIAGGMGRHWIGWALNLSILSWGALRWPRRVFRAFVRGRHGDNFYQRAFDPALLDRDADEVRAELGIEAAPRAHAGDVAAYAGWWAVSNVVSLLFLLASPVMFGLGLWGRYASRRPAPAAR